MNPLDEYRGRMSLAEFKAKLHVSPLQAGSLLDRLLDLAGGVDHRERAEIWRALVADADIDIVDWLTSQLAGLRERQGT